MPLRPEPGGARAPALPRVAGEATGAGPRGLVAPVLGAPTLLNGVLWAGVLGTVSWAVLALLAPRLPHGMAALRATPWAVWPLSPASGAALVLVAAIWARGVRATGARTVSLGVVSHGRRAAFAGGLAAIFLALQSPIAALAPHSFALLAVAHLLLRSVAPLLFVLAEPWAVLGRGLGLREEALARIGARLGARLAWLIRPVPATALFVATAYLWQQPRWQDSTLDSAPAQVALALSLLASGMVFYAFLFDARPFDAHPFEAHPFEAHPFEARPAPRGASLGAKLVMIWAAEVANILLGYFLTYSSLPIYPGFVRHGLIWGVTPLANQMYGGQTLWLCDTTMIALAAMLVIYRWASHEDRTYRPPAGPAADPALLRARQRTGNRKVVFGLLGFVGIILGVMAATVGAYEVKYHSAVPRAGHVSVNQIPG